MTMNATTRTASKLAAAAAVRLLLVILVLCVSSCTFPSALASTQPTSSNATGECSDKNDDATCANRIDPPNNGNADTTPDAESDSVSIGCVDQHKDCPKRAAKGDCGKFADVMLNECRRSCHICDGDYNEPKVENEKSCFNKSKQCSYWTRQNHCETRTKYMLETCPVSCKACATSIKADTDFGVKQQMPDEQTIADPDLPAKVKAIIRESKQYMRQVRANPSHHYGTIRETCRNSNAMCSIWAAQGECQRNPAGMLTTCAPACHTCEMLDVDRQCPMDGIEKENALKKAGDLNALFERIMDDENDENGFAKYKPVTIQRPYKSGDTRKRTWNVGPWMIKFDNFLSDEEVNRMIEVAEKKGFGQSEEITKKVKPDGSFERRISSFRTSENTWCDQACQEDELIKSVIDRIANVTGFPEANSEPLQILKYQNGQKYGEHADYIPYQKQRRCGPRVLTLLIYLSDDFTGGGTKFRFLREFTVQPKRGMAVLWPNVLNKDPMEEDEMFDHEALPVFEGIKYAVNAWLHMRDFKNNREISCV